MTLVSMQSGDRFVASSGEIFQRYGLSLRIGYDFEEYRELVKEARPDHELGPPFDPNLHTITEDDALWIVGRNVDGDLVHTQAWRILDMGGSSVGDFFTKSFRKYPPSAPNLDLERSRYRAGPGAMRMYGKTAYHGEFWIDGGKDELRGVGLSCVLGRYGFWQTVQHWDPDNAIAFMVKAVAFKGFAERLGYMHTEPGALRWFMRGNDVPVEGFMAYMHREDMRYMLELPLADLVARAA